MDSSDSLASFLDKFRARWPEWSIAETFVPTAARESTLAWSALLQELTDAAWGGSDPRPGEAKLGWWQEELAGWSRGARRHPLGQVLQARPAAWAPLARALPLLLASRDRALDAEEALAGVVPFAAIVLEIETALFGGAGDEPARARATTAACLLQSRLLLTGDGMVPMTVLAQAGEGDDDERRRLWTAQLRSRWPQRPAGSRPRRIHAALAGARLGRTRPDQPLPNWRALFVAWRAARG